MGVIDKTELKSLFGPYDRPSSDAFNNLIDTLSTDINFVSADVIPGTWSQISDSVNGGSPFTITDKSVIFLIYTDGTYVFNKMSAGTYGLNGIQVLENQFIKLAPRTDLINDTASSVSTVYSSQYLVDNFISSITASDTYINKTNPGSVIGDMDIDGTLQANNIIKPNTIAYNESTNEIEFGFYDGTSQVLDIGSSVKTVVRNIGYASGVLNPVTAFNGAGIIVDKDSTLYVNFIRSTDNLVTTYRLVKVITDSITPIVLNGLSDLLLIQDNSLEFLTDYSTTVEMNTAIQSASLGFTYSVANYDALASIPTPSLNELGLVRATVTSDATGAPNYDSGTAGYSDAVTCGAFKCIYSPVYKYSGSAWIYSYQMASPHTHTSNDVTDIDSWLDLELPLHKLSEMDTDSNSLHFTSADNTKLDGLPVGSNILTLDGNQTVSGDKTIDGLIILNALSTNSVLETDGSKHLVALHKNTAHNKNFGIVAGTISEGNHSHATYALLANQINRSGDSDIGKIGFGTIFDSNVSLTGMMGLFKTSLYIGAFGLANSTDNIIVTNEKISFGSGTVGSSSYITKNALGGGITMLHGSSKTIYADLANVKLYGGNTERVNVSSTGINLIGNTTISSGVIDYTSGGKNVKYTPDGSSETTIAMKEKIIEIGGWDMDSDSSKLIDHTIALSDIVSTNVSIIDDVLGIVSQLTDSVNASSATYQYFMNSSKIVLYRKTGGVFDSTSYDDDSINRGYITIKYKA